MRIVTLLTLGMLLTGVAVVAAAPPASAGCPQNWICTPGACTTAYCLQRIPVVCIHDPQYC